MTTSITYGIGGYNPDLPNDNIVEQLVDNGDGTGVLTDFTTSPATVTNLSNLPIPVLGPVDHYAVYADAIANAQTMQEVRDAGAALAAALGGA